MVFTSMFALEMLLKLAAFGLFDYLRNPYNIFDSIIVIIRCRGPGGRAGGRGLTALTRPVSEAHETKGSQSH